MITQNVPCKLIGKTIEKRGWLIKRPVYIIAIQIQLGDKPLTSKEVPFYQHSLMQIGEIYNIQMYSDDGDSWFFSEEE